VAATILRRIPMDDIIYYLYANGFYLLAAIAVVKLLVIILYKGFDIGYMFENFLMIYTDPGVGATPERIRFRRIHNVVTIIFYAVLLAWIAIVIIVKLVR
jgi:hypothetical protein